MTTLRAALENQEDLREEIRYEDALRRMAEPPLKYRPWYHPTFLYRQPLSPEGDAALFARYPRMRLRVTQVNLVTLQAVIQGSTGAPRTIYDPFTDDEEWTPEYRARLRAFQQERRPEDRTRYRDSAVLLRLAEVAEALGCAQVLRESTFFETWEGYIPAEIRARYCAPTSNNPEGTDP